MNKYFFFALYVAIFLLAGIYLFTSYVPEPVEAQAPPAPFSGWAWSSNIGWISFNCANQGGCGTSNYGVTVEQPASGKKKLAGFAWSAEDKDGDGNPSGAGWITFDEANLSGCPVPPCKAEIDFSNGAVAGWARAHQCISPGCAGGWDGWIHLSDINYPSPTLPGGGGVTLDLISCTLSGYAWGGGNNANFPGWISFSSKNCDPDGDGFSNGTPIDCPAVGTPMSQYGVTLPAFACERPPNPPTGLSVSANTSPAGTFCPTPWAFLFSWTYSDPNTPTSPQNAYTIEIDDDPSFNSVDLTFTGGSSSSPTHSINVTQLTPATTYSWRVQVTNTLGLTSNWSTNNSFVTPVHDYPKTNFTFSPAVVSAGDTVQFTDTTVFAPPASALTWLWNFGDGSPTSSLQSPTHIYTSPANVTVILTASDDASTGAGGCSFSRPLNVKQQLPEYKEVGPQ